jgi:sulfur carrier protein ThiS
VKVLLRNPRREVDMPAPVRVSKLLETLGINPETVLVIRNSTLVTHDERLEEPDTIEIRPVISGG